MGETGSWRTPHRLVLLTLGVATVIFLVGPMLVVIPMSFTGAKILSWPPEGYSLQWYDKMLTDPQWSRGFLNSMQVATLTAILSTILGTLAALGIVRGRFPGKGLANALILSPLIVPVIIIAIGFFAFYSLVRLTCSLPGLVLTHTALAHG